MSKRMTFYPDELIGRHNMTYYMACELLDAGAPIEFNKIDVYLKPYGIKIIGKFRHRIKQDGSHVFEWESGN